MEKYNWKYNTNKNLRKISMFTKIILKLFKILKIAHFFLFRTFQLLKKVCRSKKLALHIGQRVKPEGLVKKTTENQEIKKNTECTNRTRPLRKQVFLLTCSLIANWSNH